LYMMRNRREYQGDVPAVKKDSMSIQPAARD
jgi:hypothetical protein